MKPVAPTKLRRLRLRSRKTEILTLNLNLNRGRVFPRFRIERGLGFTILSVLHYVIIVMGAWTALAVAGVNLTSLTVVAGLLSVGIGFGLQNIASNFGGAGKYTRMAMRRDCIGFCVSGHTMGGFTVDRPQWNPLGNPPMSFAFPSEGEAPLILDMGTSFFESEHFPSLFERAPAAFFKSIGLVGVANLLGGVLAGMMLPDFRAENRRYPSAGYGAFICVLDIERFVPVETFKAELDRTMRDIGHASFLGPVV